MFLSRTVAWLYAIGLVMSGTDYVAAQAYPAKPVRILTSTAGSGLDLMSRLVAQGLSERLGQPVIIDNRGVIAIEVAAKAPPDGYTLLAFGPPLWVLPLLRQNVPWDPVRDFSPVTLGMNSPNMFVVHPSLPAKSIRDLIALAKARPGELNYAGGLPGSSSHLSGELFNAMAGIRIVRVSYKGTPAALNDLISGQVQVMIPNAAVGTPHMKSGRLRGLAVATAQPSPLLPGLPTVSASGLPGYESGTEFGFFAPAGTPAALIARLNEEMVRALNRPEVKEKLFHFGATVVGDAPAAFAATIKSEIAKWGKVIKLAGIRENN